MIIVTKWFGVFLCDKEKVRKSILFEKEPKYIAAKLALIQHGQIIPEEAEISASRSSESQRCSTPPSSRPRTSAIPRN